MWKQHEMFHIYIPTLIYRFRWYPAKSRCAEIEESHNKHASERVDIQIICSLEVK